MITLGQERNQTQSAFKGVGWTAIFVPQQGRFPLVYQGREIAIRAGSWFAAQRALDLIDTCHELLVGDTPDWRIRPVARNRAEPKWMNPNQRSELSKRVMSTSHFPLACAMAARVSRRRRWIYAAAKYHFSISTFAIHHMDLEPFKSPHLSVSRFPNDHIMFSHAIVAAYSAVEELGLEVRASATNPSRIHGKWNPAVLRDLEERLKSAGIDLGETILWTVRGPRRKIEKKRPIVALKPASWAGWFVRDVEVHVTDAIAYADWLRDCVASHNVKELTRILSPYEVVNVQHLARRLFLESVGFWR